MEDISNRLIISRMVSDPVIKGMEAKAALLNKRLQLRQWDAQRENELGLGVGVEPQRTKIKLQLSFEDLGVKQNHLKGQFSNFKIAAEEQFQRLKGEFEEINHFNKTMLSNILQGKVLEKEIEMNKSLHALESNLEAVYEQMDDLVITLKALLYERQWELDFEEEVNNIVFQSLIRRFCEGLEGKAHEQICLAGSPHKNLMRMANELLSVRQELEDISRSLFVEENDIISSEMSKESKSTMLDTTESDLQQMSNGRLTSYFKTVMTEMKRDHENHELIVHKKTEECYRLKKDLLKDKGSSYLMKDKDFDALKKKIPEIIAKLDHILLENKKSSMFCSEDDNIGSLKYRVDNVLSENQHLRAMLVNKINEVKCPATQVSDVANEKSHLSLAEANFLEQIKKLNCDIEDVNVEVPIREEIYKCIHKQLLDKIKCDMADAEIEAIFTRDICMIIFRESLSNAAAAIDHMMMASNEEKERRVCLEAMKLEFEKTLCFEIEEKEKLKLEIELISVFMEEQQKSALEMNSRLMKQKEHSELVCKELYRLKEKESQRDRLLYDSKRECEPLSGRMDDALKQIYQCMVEKIELHKKLKETTNNLEEAETKKIELHSIIQENQSVISAAVASELQQKKQMEAVVISVQELSKAVVDFESRARKSIAENDSRLKMLHHQCSPLVQQVNLLKKKGLAYKHALELRCSDLQKAEVEVDLLGNHVDTLQDFLGKIYMGLDHYSPILQHYPGIMETLELIRRAIRGEASNQRRSN